MTEPLGSAKSAGEPSGKKSHLIPVEHYNERKPIILQFHESVVVLEVTGTNCLASRYRLNHNCMQGDLCFTPAYACCRNDKTFPVDLRVVCHLSPIICGGDCQ